MSEDNRSMARIEHYVSEGTTLLDIVNGLDLEDWKGAMVAIDGSRSSSAGGRPVWRGAMHESRPGQSLRRRILSAASSHGRQR